MELLSFTSDVIELLSSLSGLLVSVITLASFVSSKKEKP